MVCHMSFAQEECVEGSSASMEAEEPILQTNQEWLKVVNGEMKVCPVLLNVLVSSYANRGPRPSDAVTQF